MRGGEAQLRISKLTLEFHQLLTASPKQLIKTPVIGLPKFLTVYADGQYNQDASFCMERLFFEDYSFGSAMSNSFFAEII